MIKISIQFVPEFQRRKFREILWYFSADIKAVKIAEFTKISEKTINKITKNIRISMASEREK